MITFGQFINKAQELQEVYRAITLGPSRSPIGRERQRRDASERAAFRRAGVRRSRPGGRARFNAIRSNNTSTAITSYPNQTAYAREFMPDKNKRKSVLDGTSNVTPTSKRALYLRRLARQTGSRSNRQVHAVDILPTKDFKKGDPGYVSRGREFHKDVKDIPNKVKDSGGKPGDVIAGKASEPLSGSKNVRRGRESRQRTYTKKLGASKRDPITDVQIARVKG